MPAMLVAVPIPIRMGISRDHAPTGREEGVAHLLQVAPARRVARVGDADAQEPAIRRCFDRGYRHEAVRSHIMVLSDHRTIDQALPGPPVAQHPPVSQAVVDGADAHRCPLIHSQHSSPLSLNLARA